MGIDIKFKPEAVLEVLKEFGVDIRHVIAAVDAFKQSDGFLKKAENLFRIAQAVAEAVEWERINGLSAEDAIHVGSKALDALFEFSGTVWGVVPAVGAVNLLISGAVGLLFIGMGNYLPRVKQNYTLGIKTPWALADPENWRRTQRFGGACFMVLGVGLIVMGVAGSVLSSEVVAAVIAALAFGSAGAAYAYSYLLWRKSQRAVR